MFFIPFLSFESGIIVNKFQTLLLSIHNSGVIRFDVMSRREKERTEDYLNKTMEVTEAPQVHKATEHICKLYQRFYTQTIYPKVIRNLYATPPSLFVPSAPPWHCVYLRPLRVSMCLLYKPFNLSSIFGRTSYYPVTMSLITLLPCLPLPCLMSSITLLPCLLLPCTMSSITLSHVFHYSVTMSLITLSHVFHYSVTMSLITLSPSGNAKPQKKSWQVNYPKDHTPQNN